MRQQWSGPSLPPSTRIGMQFTAIAKSSLWVSLIGIASVAASHSLIPGIDFAATNPEANLTSWWDFSTRNDDSSSAWDPEWPLGEADPTPPPLDDRVCRKPNFVVLSHKECGVVSLPSLFWQPHQRRKYFSISAFQRVGIMYLQSWQNS